MGERLVLEAESYSFQKSSNARGNSESFDMQLQAYQNSKNITRFRLYHEVLQKVLPDAKLYLKPGAESGGEMDLFIMNGKTKGYLPPSFVEDE
jgi:hypothetical protein